MRQGGTAFFTKLPSTPKMCPPQDLGRCRWAVSWCSCVCGVFFVWARAAHLRPAGTSASGGQVFCLGVLSCLRRWCCFYWPPQNVSPLLGIDQLWQNQKSKYLVPSTQYREARPHPRSIFPSPKRRCILSIACWSWVSLGFSSKRPS
jgi:hypothetical protein